MKDKKCTCNMLYKTLFKINEGQKHKNKPFYIFTACTIPQNWGEVLKIELWLSKIGHSKFSSENIKGTDSMRTLYKDIDTTDTLFIVKYPRHKVEPSTLS